ncbi:ferric uptake regulator, Fur family [Methylobacterium sp. 4-46]|uniref:Fur family transcriptional regulator n=1 Tax=unclassified Methylobacterium TaxID=2615210 RepID=UPI000152E05B|nr:MULTISPECIES: Fur family transcriptional regulator [Methylobacterium]ACA19701.1 ferric uptake regulator, Fur family [Methylobacterium sp. 4-46]WFT78897.1 Fur family transcriptional regulator [Methylobacterium nodulans]
MSEPAGTDHGCGEGRAGLRARAERLCRERGLQFTPLRQRTLEVIAGEARPLGAYDIAERLSAPGRRVAAVSVYRALDFLTENGLVHRIASRNAFVPCEHAHHEGEGVVFLICRACGAVDETSSEEIERGLDRTLAQAGFRPASRIVEIEGECGACQERGAERGAEPGAEPGKA